jgi:restriction endonuclease S subunit
MLSMTQINKKSLSETDIITKFIMPLLIPPLAEQHHIVAKVEELMILCEQLKTNINNARITQLNLTDAIVDSSI